MKKINMHVLKAIIGFVFLFLFASSGTNAAEPITLEMVPPVSAVAYLSNHVFNLPATIMNNPLSTDQDFTNLLDNDPDTYYQPAQGSNAPTIGSDVLVSFEFPEVPSNAIIHSIEISIGVSAENTSQANRMGFGLLAYNSMEPTRYFDVDLGPPGTKGPFLVSESTADFPVPPLVVAQAQIPSVYTMSLAKHELTADNVRNLEAAIIGVNEVPSLFDRVSLINATIVYTVPAIPTLSTWMLVALGAILLIAALIFRKRIAA